MQIVKRYIMSHENPGLFLSYCLLLLFVQVKSFGQKKVLESFTCFVKLLCVFFTHVFIEVYGDFYKYLIMPEENVTMNFIGSQQKHELEHYCHVCVCVFIYRLL